MPNVVIPYTNEYPTKYRYTAQPYLFITRRDICISVCTGLHLENLLVRAGVGQRSIKKGPMYEHMYL